jgi:hypothetical protein
MKGRIADLVAIGSRERLGLRSIIQYGKPKCGVFGDDSLEVFLSAFKTRLSMFSARIEVDRQAREL